ncbi:regulation of nuclear pre-mRNA domain-containing protein 2 isoform X2 [Diabrotica virgifera virgifera]|uniref:CID domain-containing protein n=1 Tax=Diabrotica virgifera virgifera TaxID=50390 RepID=A0ABM5JN54_DIAVI|nr:regulation of nuclear pre-mRNA domain-containing protein 2 isoform X2 [Diabrotica virgifera virgifera]
MGTQTISEGDFDILQFEKQLTTLKDSQEAINNCCQWCLQYKNYHKKIVNAWLNVLKRVKVEQRLNLFYLANDVIQYSKRKNYDFVESWGIALQKATTMVRDDKVKHKILRIFKIWEQRGVYNNEFISDLCGLINVVPSAPKNDEPHEFQPSYVIGRIKTCARLEKDTDTKLKILKEHNPKIQLDDGLLASLKDRANVDDVERELEVYIAHINDYMQALRSEVKQRENLISILKQAETQLEADRKDVKVVANAYKMFGLRVKTFQRKLEEHKQTLSSPIPSPDINAPSPSPDSDLDLPEEAADEVINTIKKAPLADYNPKAELQFSAGYYTPNKTTDSSSADLSNVSNSFLSTNGFASFMGSESFNLETFSSTLFSNVSSFNNTNDSSLETSFTPPISDDFKAPNTQVPPPLIEPTTPQPSYGYDTNTIPLLPPPMPPFSKAELEFGNNGSYGSATTESNNAYVTDSTFANPSYQTSNITYQSEDNFREDMFEPPVGANPYPPSEANPYPPSEANPYPPSEVNPYPPSEEYNPEEDLSTWEPEAAWNPPPPTTDDSQSSLGTKDVDHRNLISLTGSPGHSSSQNSLSNSIWNSQSDQDYRINRIQTLPPDDSANVSGDQDYRFGFNIDQLKLPPPPPPPPKFQEQQIPPLLLDRDAPSPPLSPDNVDMDLSDDENYRVKSDNLKVIIDGSENDDQSFLLEPPPPLPELPDDETNNFLDDLTHGDDLNEFGNISDNLEDSLSNNSMSVPPPLMMNFNELVAPPIIPASLNTSLPPPPPLHPPPMMMGQPGPLAPPPNPWLSDDDLDNSQNNQDLSGGEDWGSDDNWMGPPPPQMPPPYMKNQGFRGRGHNNRGNFVKRGRGRGGGQGFNNFNSDQNFGGGNFRGNSRGRSRGGNRGNNRGFFPRGGGGNFRGDFRGGFRGGF